METWSPLQSIVAIGIAMIVVLYLPGRAADSLLKQKSKK